MGVNIFLKQFKNSNQVLELIKDGDETKIGAEKLNVLKSILPTEDEVNYFYFLCMFLVYCKEPRAC